MQILYKYHWLQSYLCALPLCRSPRPVRAAHCTNGENSMSQWLAGNRAGRCRHSVLESMESALPIFDADNPINKPTYMAITNANKYECIYIYTYT